MQLVFCCEEIQFLKTLAIKTLVRDENRGHRSLPQDFVRLCILECQKIPVLKLIILSLSLIFVFRKKADLETQLC